VSVFAVLDVSGVSDVGAVDASLVLDEAFLIVGN
jgi:hypothetical protein